jgi:predicted PurR-regulated permease PerM
MDNQTKQTIKIMLVVTAFVLTGLLLFKLISLIVLLYTAFLLSLILEPMVRFFSSKVFLNKLISRSTAVVMTYLVFVISVAGIFLLIIPQAVSQLSLLGDVVMPIVNLPVKDIFGALSLDLSRFYPDVFSFTASFVSKFFYLLFGLAASAYISIEWPDIKRRLLRLPIGNYKREIEDSLSDIEDSLGNWAKGQLILMIVVGVTSTIGLVIIGGGQYAASLGLLSGLLEFVPMVGPIATAFLAFFIYLPISPVKALAVVGLFVLIQQLESNILVPKVMQKISGFSPLTVLVAIFIGSEFYGVVGALIVLPTFMIGAILLSKFSKYLSIHESE